MKSLKVILWICRIVSALILIQTLYFKFTGAEESVYIFTRVGMEPWGRLATGIAELIASVMILIPRISVFGALMAMGIMAGAIAGHLLILGIEVMEDGGQLFFYALIVLLTSAFIVVTDRRKIADLFNFRKAVVH